MTKIIPLYEPCDVVIAGSQGSLAMKGFIFENVFDTRFFNLLQNHIQKVISSTSKSTYFTQNCSFTYEGEKVHLGSNLGSSREQNIVYDVTFDKDYYYQTKDTIKEWSVNKIRNTVSPIFQHCVKTVENLPPVNTCLDEWIFYRCHINYLPFNRYLALHHDGMAMLCNTNHIRDARMLSLTFYLYDSKEGMGGELWAVNGFVYKPRKNSAIIFNGNQVLHGVTQNIDTEPRLAFTMRMFHKDDLYLPGHPSKWLYNVEAISELSL